MKMQTWESYSDSKKGGKAIKTDAKENDIYGEIKYTSQVQIKILEKKEIKINWWKYQIVII